VERPSSHCCHVLYQGVDAEGVLELGFQRFMPKPLDPDELVQEILKLVGRGEAGKSEGNS
jgi:DNA-binding response OmpR family regulator